MIEFDEELRTHDGSMYWDGITGFHYDRARGTVVAGRISVPRKYYEDEYGEGQECEDWSELFYDAVCTFRPYSHRHTEALEYTGRELLKNPEFILARFPVEYVPIDGRYVVRVSHEGSSRRACKGFHQGMIQYLPLLNGADDPDSNTLAASMVSAQFGGMADYAALVRGMSSVLALGRPDCMRRNIGLLDARSNAKQAVRAMFTTPQCVVVPDFPVAIIKHRSREHEAYVLFRGHHIGTLHYNNGVLEYRGRGKTANRSIRKHFQAGQEELALNLFADRVVWS